MFTAAIVSTPFTCSFVLTPLPIPKTKFCVGKQHLVARGRYAQMMSSWIQTFTFACREIQGWFDVVTKQRYFEVTTAGVVVNVVHVLLKFRSMRFYKR